jgi:hypothetical protein
MSRGRGRVQRTIMEAVNETRYGCTIRSLAYRVYGGDREQGPTEAQLEVVRRAVDELIAAELVVERVVLGTGRYILPAIAPVPGSDQVRTPAAAQLARQHILQCLDCDLRWVSEEGAPHPLCWSCGQPGTPARAPRRQRSTSRTSGVSERTGTS